MQAPLGLAVIGGLVTSTFATLLVLPSIFAVVVGRKVARSPSIYPDDPNSPHFDPDVFREEGHVHEGASAASGQSVPSHPDTGPGGHGAADPPAEPPASAAS